MQGLGKVTFGVVAACFQNESNFRVDFGNIFSSL
jgi:hypothetical protein